MNTQQIELKTAADAFMAVKAEVKSIEASSLPTRAKGRRLDELADAEKRASQRLVAAKNALDMAQMKSHPVLAGGASTLPGGERALMAEQSGRGSFAPAAGKQFGGPRITPDPVQSVKLFDAARAKSTYAAQVETKALDFDGSIPAGLSPQLVAFRREPTRVASLLPTMATGAPSFEFIRHTGTTGSATTVAPGATKPELTLVTDTLTATARKIAAHIGVTDETLADYAASAAYVTSELTRALTSTENQQLLSGDGTGTNLEGILSTSGILTRTQAASPETELDTLELALNDLRVGASFTTADGIIMNPSDFSAARLLKNSYGEYLLGHPTDDAPPTLWGVPVVVTTDCPAKSVIVGNFAEGAMLVIRSGIELSTLSAGTDWTDNITRFRAEERIALAVVRPANFVHVTLS